MPGHTKFPFILLSLLITQLLSANEKPNVLFIMSDDLNTALSGLGHPECKTPYLDEFAKTGVTFTKAFCQYPICGPSRASIMTGQYPLKNGVVRNGGKVKPERMTLPRYFGKYGYWNARVSKIYHMGIPVDIMQGTSGTDHAASWKEAYNMLAMETLTPSKLENFTDPQSVAHYPAERTKWIAAKEKGEPYQFQRILRGDYAVLEVADKDEHLLPDKMATDKAIELLQDRAYDKKSFFLAVGLVRPHFPFVATDSSIRHYDPKTTALPYIPDNDHDDMAPQSIGKDINVGDAAVRKIRRGYYGAVTYMDQQVGRLLAELERLELRDNTIVVFVSDHGFLLGEHHMWKKSRLWEEAIRTPLIISAPGKPQGV
jgi:iduronate 2-sulfatase